LTEENSWFAAVVKLEPDGLGEALAAAERAVDVETEPTVLP